MSPRTARIALLFWSLLLAAVLFPWTSFLDHAHWYKVAWIPFASRPLRARDILLNVLVFVPLGWLFRRSISGAPAAWLGGLAFAATLSLGAEYAQIFSHTRFPSMTDVVCNGLGAVVGLWLGARGARRRRTGSAIAATKLVT